MAQLKHNITSNQSFCEIKGDNTTVFFEIQFKIMHTKATSREIKRRMNFICRNIGIDREVFDLGDILIVDCGDSFDLFLNVSGGIKPKNVSVQLYLHQLDIADISRSKIEREALEGFKLIEVYKEKFIEKIMSFQQEVDNK